MKCVFCGNKAFFRENTTNFLYCSNKCQKKSWTAKLTLQQLFIEHVDYTHNVIVAIARGLSKSDTDAYISRLLKNQEHIGKVAKSQKLTDLLKVHIVQAGDILIAIKSEKDPKSIIEKWYENGNDIANHLHSLNPQKLPLDSLRNAFKIHLDQTLDEATAIFKGDMKGGIKKYDEARQHMINVSQLLAHNL